MSFFHFIKNKVSLSKKQTLRLYTTINNPFFHEIFFVYNEKILSLYTAVGDIDRYIVVDSKKKKNGRVVARITERVNNGLVRCFKRIRSTEKKITRC